MAKTSVKPAIEKAPVKKIASKTAAKSSSESLDKVAESIVSKLKSLDIESQLQSDIEWCLGSYRYDQNPVGLIDNGNKALEAFKVALDKKTKGITAKWIADIEKALKK